MQRPPPSAPRGGDTSSPSASNTLFLIGFGMFLAMAFLPTFVNAVARLFGLLVVIAVAGAFTNPSDHSFAVWISSQDNVRVKNQRDGQPAGVKQWVSAVVKTAIAAVTNEKLMWTFHNVVVFSVVYVPTLNRYPTLLELCKAPWIARFTKGGVQSALVNTRESKRLQQRQQERDEWLSDGDSADSAMESVQLQGSPERGSLERVLAHRQLPPGVLPVVRSPRPDKVVYVPTPTKTPRYFRWKPKALAGAPSALGHRPVMPPPRTGPSAPSPRVRSISSLPEKDRTDEAQSDRWSEATTRAPSPEYDIKGLKQMGPDLFAVDQPSTSTASARRSSGLVPPSNDCQDPQLTTQRDSDGVSAATAVATSPPSPPRTAESNLFQYDALAVSPPPTREQPAPASTQVVDLTLSVPAPPASDAVTKPPAATTPTATSTATPQPSPPSISKEMASHTVKDEEEEEDHDATNNIDDEDPAALAVPIEFTMNEAARGPQDKVIAQQVLRSRFLRRYLHATNLVRTLKETEQAIRSAALHGGIPTQRGGASLFSRSFISKTPPAPDPQRKSVVAELLGEDASALLNDKLPVLRRLSSIDKAINKTVKRIRRLSGAEDATAVTTKRRSSSLVKPNDKMRAKFQSLKAIGEGEQLLDGKARAAMASGRFHGLDFIRGAEDGAETGDGEEGDDGDGGQDDEDEFGLPGNGGTRLDPSSAHMMRICQHVIAKRAIKAFLRQEMSLITLVEIALRDSPAMQSTWMAAPQSSLPTANTAAGTASTSSRPPSASGGDHAASTPEVHRIPIKSWTPEMVEAVSIYLNEVDKQLSLEGLFQQALQAEQSKLWKRAILLASACIVLDRDCVLAVLLRARCCRRLGLWAQAIKDLTHAISLRADEYKLVLLRACLYTKMGELQNALTDVSRALAFHPKSIDALLLRADIFHRQNAIGASLQDLTTALLFDPSCWRAYYDRATIRIRAVEGDDQSLIYHWEHMKYEKLLATIIEDYMNALRKGCQMVEVVETVGDLTIRLLEFTGDANVLRQVVNNLTHLLQILSYDHRRSFHIHNAAGPRSSLTSASVLAAAAVAAVGDDANSSMPKELSREQLLAAIHAQRGRLYVLLGNAGAALADFDQAVITEYHYPVAHFYRGAFATLVSKEKDEEAMKTNLQHLSKCVALDPTIAGAYTVRGALHLRELKFNSALQDFKAAVATDPTLYEVWLQIALIYLNHYHDCEECIKACSNALTNDSCLARALYLRGEAYNRQGNIKAALHDYGRLTIAQPDDRWAQLMRGRLLLQMKLARPALYAFIQFMELGSYNYQQNGNAGSAADKRAHLLCGRAYKILSRFQQAVDQFQRAVTVNPTSDNLVLLSESLHSMGDTENSLRVSEKVISSDPGSHKGYVRRAQLLVSIGQFQNALAEYDKALFLAPKEGRIYYERGIVAMQLYLRWRVAFQLNFGGLHRATSESSSLGAPLSPSSAAKKPKKRSPFEPRIPAIEVEATLGTEPINDEKTVLQSMKACYNGALADFAKCIRLEPSLADPFVDRAELYVLGEDYDRAFQDYAAAIERNPRCARAYVNLGVLKCQFAAFAAAIADFDHAIRCDARLSLAFFDRAVAYQKLQLWRHAERSYGACIALGGVGRDIDAHRNRAIARCHLGAFQDALADFDEVRQSAPDDDQLHGGLGYVLLQLGRYEDAARCFATYGRLNRDTFADSGNAYFNLGCSQSHISEARHQGLLKTALRFYVRAARLHPSNLDLRLNLAHCLRRMGVPWQAVAQCDAIHQAKPLHHAGLECKALALYQLHRLPEAIEGMNAAIRMCVASSSALENIFYAFAHESIHRHALERKTVAAPSRRLETVTATATATSGGRPPTSPAKDPREAMAEAMNAQLQELRAKRTRVGGADDKPNNKAPEIVLTGSSKQMLSLYMLNRGILYEKLGQWDDATRDYRDAVHFDPLSVHAHLCLATLWLMQARYDDSRAQFERALALEPRNGLAHLNLGALCLCVDDLDGAAEHLDVAIQELPTCSYAFANKAVVLARRGELRGAEQLLKRAIEELPSRKEYYLARGKIIAQQKRLQDAMVDFSTALHLGYDGRL
ncbi:hypothetical protein P43SY_002652 [Pythium insidiosum]|uniref:Uncharacterized protein n=1 Tax=Pythium insidiosum TaxID=114742 RepID=A0AAD5QFK7_PYTIN|nr:hypothetical protein P43SY_002652 [Pythium insidiosum]